MSGIVRRSVTARRMAGRETRKAGGSEECSGGDALLVTATTVAAATRRDQGRPADARRRRQRERRLAQREGWLRREGWRVAAARGLAATKSETGGSEHEKVSGDKEEVILRFGGGGEGG